MSWQIWDEDEWEPVFETTPTSCSMGRRRRDPAEVARIKAERERKREDEILAQADAIRARRGVLA